MLTKRLVWPILVGAVLLSGCARRTDSLHPRSALSSYVRAVRSDDPRAAYALLSKKVRSEVTLEEFTRRWKESQGDLKLQAEAIEKARPKEKSYVLDASIELGKRRTVTLAREKEGWRIRGGVGSGLDATTPKEAVQALVRALESNNFPAFLRLLSKPRQEQFQREMSLRLEKLKANLDRDFEVSGNRARLQYDPRYWIQLIQEKGIWKIVEFN